MNSNEIVLISENWKRNNFWFIPGLAHAACSPCPCHLVVSTLFAQEATWRSVGSRCPVLAHITWFVCRLLSLVLNLPGTHTRCSCCVWSCHFVLIRKNQQGSRSRFWELSHSQMIPHHMETKVSFSLWSWNLPRGYLLHCSSYQFLVQHTCTCNQLDKKSRLWDRAVLLANDPAGMQLAPYLFGIDLLCTVKADCESCLVRKWSHIAWNAGASSALIL